MSSVVVKSLDREAVRRAVEDFAARIYATRPEVERIIWFGSWVHGTPTPGSDVDLCLVLTHSEKAFRDRIPDYLPFGFPVGLDLFPYTREELARLRETSPEWYRTLMDGQEL